MINILGSDFTTIAPFSNLSSNDDIKGGDSASN